MKRCIFSNSLIEDFRWRYAGDYACYQCHQRLFNQDIANELAHFLHLDQLLKKITRQEQKKKLKKKPALARVKVDRRVIQQNLPPPEHSESAHCFSSAPKTEGPIYPRIRYPYLTMVLGRR